MTITRDDLSPFARGYIAALLFSTNDESDPTGGAPMDANYDIEDFAQETLQTIVDDCAKFVEANESRYADADDLLCSDGVWTPEESAGADFWYTRNGHGVGFWDPDRKRHYGEANAEAMHEYSKAAGECYPYIGDDGKVYI